MLAPAAGRLGGREASSPPVVTVAVCGQSVFPRSGGSFHFGGFLSAPGAPRTWNNGQVDLFIVGAKTKTHESFRGGGINVKPLETLLNCLLELESMYLQTMQSVLNCCQAEMVPGGAVGGREARRISCCGCLVYGKHVFPFAGGFPDVQVDLWAMVGGLGMELSRA